MDFSLTEEQRMFVKSVERFASNKLLPTADIREEKGEFSYEIWKEVAAIGLTGLCIPEEYGGTGADAITTLIGYEALARGSRDWSLVSVLGTSILLCAMSISDHGSQFQKEKYLPKFASGENIGALALTEPDAGSDASALRTTARREGDYYILNGSKTFITNAPIANVFLVYASHDRSKRADALSAFLVDRDCPGLMTPKPLSKFGIHSCPTGEVIFEDCKVPVENLMGVEGKGFKTMLASLGWERLFFGAITGYMDALLQLAINYSKERKQFGKPIGDFQLVQAMLAEMKIDIEASRLLGYQVASKKDKGEDIALDCAIAKTFISEAFERVAYKSVQVFGGYGCMREYPVGHALWASKITTIGGGTSQLQRIIIGKMLINK